MRPSSIIGSRGARRAGVALALALTAGLLGGCGHSGSAAPKAGAVRAPTSRISGDSRTWPLTGLPVAPGASAVLRRPVLVLKMDNTPASAPQLGLKSADLVAEELVEGGITRLAAFYYSTIPGEVGPVRSMRASDVAIVAPVHATLVTSGAARVTLGLIHKAGLRYLTEGSPGFARSAGRRAPYNLMTNLHDVVGALHPQAGRPQDYLPFGPAGALTGTRPAHTVDVRFSGSHTTVWSYRGGHYLPQNSYAAPGQAFAADNVLVLRVTETDAGYRDPAGNAVPETVLNGTGDALLFRGGKVVHASWTKGSATDPIELNAGGKPLAVPAGHTWIELVPKRTGGVTWR